MTTQLSPEAILHGPSLANEIPSVTLPEFIRGHWLSGRMSRAGYIPVIDPIHFARFLV